MRSRSSNANSNTGRANADSTPPGGVPVPALSGWTMMVLVGNAVGAPAAIGTATGTGEVAAGTPIVAVRIERHDIYGSLTLGRMNGQTYSWLIAGLSGRVEDGGRANGVIHIEVGGALKAPGARKAFGRTPAPSDGNHR